MLVQTYKLLQMKLKKNLPTHLKGHIILKNYDKLNYELNHIQNICNIFINLILS